jgi:hypothetical protein
MKYWQVCGVLITLLCTLTNGYGFLEDLFFKIVNAQYGSGTGQNIEEQLQLAKEKVASATSAGNTDSNLMLNQFSKHLSNITLSQEQVTEIEKDRSAIFTACIDRLGQKEQPGSLCDAFSDYLVEKCKRFDNLLPYCTGEDPMPATYTLKRVEQLSCLKNPPAYSDIEKIKDCMNLIDLNASYYDRPPILLSGNSSKDKSDYDVTYHVLFTAKNAGINPITFEKIIYDFYQEGKKLASGCVGKPSGCRSPNSYAISGLSSDRYQFDYTVGTNQSSVPPFILNGTYHYSNSDSNTTIIAEPFRFVVH